MVVKLCLYHTHTHTPVYRLGAIQQEFALDITITPEKWWASVRFILL